MDARFFVTLAMAFQEALSSGSSVGDGARLMLGSSYVRGLEESLLYY